MTSQPSQWKGPQPTPGWIGIDTPLPYLNESWNIAVRLLDKGRRLYQEGNGSKPCTNPKKAKH